MACGRVQSLVRRLADGRGFDVTLEKMVHVGHGHVDAALEGHDHATEIIFEGGQVRIRVSDLVAREDALSEADDETAQGGCQNRVSNVWQFD